MFVDYVSEMISFYECFAYPDMSLHENDRFFFSPQYHVTFLRYVIIIGQMEGKEALTQ